MACVRGGHLTHEPADAIEEREFFRPRMQTVLIHLAQILIASLGGLIFHVLGVPGAWLSGSTVAVILWSLAGWSKPMPRSLADLAMLTSGASMGAAVTPAAIAAVGRYPLSLVLLVIGVVAISAASAFWLTRISGWRKGDAVLASAPGALSTVMAIAIDRNAAVAPIAIVQNLRLFILIALLPGVVVMTGGGALTSGLLGQGQEIMPAGGMAIMLLASVATGLLFKRLGIAAPILLGAALVSTLCHATGSVSGVIPPVIATGGLILMGAFIADRFRDLDFATVRRSIFAGIGSFTIGMSIAVAFAVLASQLAGVSFANAMIAFAPGGLEAMTVLALMLGLDPLYVGIHHFVRFIGIGFALPVVLTWLQPKPEA
ncbi:AbrB family transcriptional regulator [Microvirga flavescens]|uniref:AbrB family transcriptional regulator n=1 Tax=Microvirga flavescens TaxID=2249811 RepID=UPI001FE0169A|nr:AbrB family transcriptional regulator [Microvirga flavescens]